MKFLEAGKRRRKRTLPMAAYSTRSTSRINRHDVHSQKTQQPAGLWAGPGIHGAVPQPDRVDPAGCDVSESVIAHLEPVLARRGFSARCRFLSADICSVADR